MRTLMLASFVACAVFGKSLFATAAKQSMKAGSKSEAESGKKSDRPSQRQTADFQPPVFHISYTLNGFGEEHAAKMREALRRLAQVVKSESFKKKVLGHTFQGELGYYQNKGMSNLEIYQAILAGAETLNPIEDNTMNLRITLYHSDTNTVGYTYPNTEEVWVNRKYFERYSLAEVANNAMHEWLHKIGFEHSYYKTKERRFTVPYAIGEIVEEVFLEQGL